MGIFFDVYCMLVIDNLQCTTAVPQSTSIAVVPHSLSTVAVSTVKSAGEPSGSEPHHPHSKKGISGHPCHVAEPLPGSLSQQRCKPIQTGKLTIKYVRS